MGTSATGPSLCVDGPTPGSHRRSSRGPPHPSAHPSPAALQATAPHSPHLSAHVTRQSRFPGNRLLQGFWDTTFAWSPRPSPVTLFQCPLLVPPNLPDF